MESKRLILAVVLSIAVFVVWQAISYYMGWLPSQVAQRRQNATEQAPQAAAVPGDPDSAPEAPAPADALAVQQLDSFIPSEGRLVTVDTPLYRAVFHSGGGILRQFVLKDYRVSLDENTQRVNLVSDAAAGQAPMGLLLDGLPTWTGTAWALEGDNLNIGADGSGVLRFSTEINGLRLIRELLFTGDGYTITEKLRVVSSETKAVNLAFTFDSSAFNTDLRTSVFAKVRYAVFGGAEPGLEESQHNPTRVAWLQDGSYSEENSRATLAEGELVQGKVSWMAVMNNYFMGAVSMDDESASAKGRLFGDVYRVLIGKTGVVASPGRDAQLECSYFLGPKEAKRLENTPNHLDKALDYGFFSIIAKPLIYLLDFFYRYVGNYGLAIILMTVVIKLLFWPLSQKSYKSMQQMKQLQPKMLKLREKYKDDKESMNREVMQLYKTYKVNPAGGCLPILVQIPVFFGLYQALLNAIELRHAAFIPTLPFTDMPWLADLTSPDPFLITPLVMGATMFLQQKMTPMPGDPTQAKIMMLMPIVFTGLFLTFPSGLVVYWLVNNVISIGQQWWQLRRKTA
ncbi:MAG: membrane protein insertase YidC [Desulfovibrio sp.]|jgi:YidC/Oxa1 family membrane protein insertase|nr:membrane protein insertase YidC [Desulfovibrio sp.]